MSIIDELIYDRTQADLDTALSIIENNETFPDDNLRYSWDCRALNRTEKAMQYVNAILQELGYFKNMQFKTDWFSDEITPEQSKRYINNLKTLREYLILPSTTPDSPDTINGMSIQRANEIEKILHDIDEAIRSLESNLIYSGVCNSGQDRVWQQRFRRSPYTRLDYIYCNGNQHIDIGIVTSNDLRIITKIMPTVTATAAKHLIGVTSSSSGITFNLSTSNNSTSRWGNKNTNSPFGLYEGNEYVIEMSENGYYVNGEKKWNIIKNNFVGTMTMLLFTAKISGGNISPQKFIGNFYYCKIYKKDVLIRDYIPVLNNVGTPCLLDKVEWKFYYNQGTGSFTASN